MNLLYLFLIVFAGTFVRCDESSIAGGTKCVDYEGQPKMCYPPFQNHASAGLKVIATNTCGLKRRQKYCVGLSSIDMTDRCAHCHESNPEERHSADYLTDHNVNNWWQSETLADNKTIHFHESINLTVNLGKQFHVTFIHLQFKSPRPRAMVIYRKFDDNYPWAPWLYLASNCKTYFNMENSKGKIINNFDDILCTEEFSSLNEFYNGIVMFATIFGRPGADDFFNNKKMMDWATASQIRIELKKMHTFGDQNSEEELLLTYFYAIKSFQVAARCWCNGHGNECRRSTGEGIEPKLFCVCHPSHHTTGQSCEKCDNFYQDIPWQMATATNPNICKVCNCNGNSDSCIFNEELYIKSGNVSGGLCLNCLGNTKGAHCEDCIEGFYKDLQQPNRCIPCNCDPKGRESVQCDQTGKCTCLPGVDGDKCTRCKGDHYNFGSTGCQPCNCNLHGINSTARLQCNPSNGICYCKKNVIGEKCESCVQGYFSLTADDPLGCRPCFCFAHTKECTDAKGFVMVPIISDFDSTDDEWKYGIGTEQPTFPPMLDISVKPPAITWYRNRDSWQNDYFLWAPAKFIGNQRMSYNLFLDLSLSFGSRPDQDVAASQLVSMINDVELVSDTMSVSVPFNTYNSLEVGNEANLFRFRLNEESGFWRDRIDHFRFISILSNLIAIKIRLTNPLGFVKLHKAVLYTAVDKKVLKFMDHVFPATTNVERCSCPPQYTGLSCEQCSVGHHRLSAVGTEFVKCVKCMCNNQSNVCDIRTGKCNCKYNSTGHNCEKCEIGFYGDPTTMIPNICKPCECPGGTACELVKMGDGNRVVCTDCPDNLGGYRCNRCRDNYFGNPSLNISCQPCNCHGNIDYFNSCDSVSGKCSACLYNSAGDHCETCRTGYRLFANEHAPNRCKKCICNPIGSVDDGISCNVITGQCQCHPLVAGLKCDLCKPGYFNLTPVKSCEPCNCFGLGSLNHTCDFVSGQCFCKPGVVGKNCDKCDSGYFNMSQNGCQKCECDLTGSESQDCDLKTGKCDCKPNIMGEKCDRCMENHHNITGGCPNCPPCYDLIQKKIISIKTEIISMIKYTNMRNSSENVYQNLSNTLEVARHLNKTINDMFEVILANYTSIISVKDKMEKSKKLVQNVSHEFFHLQKNKKNENLGIIIQEIRTLKKKIENFINIIFLDKLEKLKAYIKDKSMSDSNITNAAEIAKTSLNEINQLKSKIVLQVLKTEKDLNNSLIYYVELITSYYTFLNGSGEFDIQKLRTMSDKVVSDGLVNLNNINNVYNKKIELEKMVNITKEKLKGVNSDADALFKEFLNFTEYAREFETKLQSIMISLPNLESLEKEISSKSVLNMAISKNMTDLRHLKGKLDEAQQNILNALAKAQSILVHLEEINKDFDDVVKKSRNEADLNMDKLPLLKTKLDSIKLEVQTLKDSSADLIQKMKVAYTNSEKLYLQSNELESKYKNLFSMTLDLKKKAKENLVVSLNNKAMVEESLKNESVLLSEFENIKKTLIKTTLINKSQKDSTDLLELSLQNIENQLQKLEQQSKVMSDEKIDSFSKMLDSLSVDLTTYEENEVNSLTTELSLLDEEWVSINQELDESDLEIKRLDQINSYMIGSPVCHKSGGKVER